MRSLHQRRTRNHRALGHIGDVVHPGGNRSLDAVVPAVAGGLGGCACCRSRGGALQHHRIVLDIGQHANHIDADPGFRRRAAHAVALLVVGAEQVQQGHHVLIGAHAVDRAHHRSLGELIAVAHVEFDADADRLRCHPLAQEILAAQFFEQCHGRIDAGEIVQHPTLGGVVEHQVQRALVDVELIHAARAERRKHRAEGWNQDAGNTDLAGITAGVERTAAAVGQQRKLARVITLHRDFLEDRIGHVGVHLAAHGERCRLQIEAGGFADVLADGALGAAPVQLDTPAGVVVRVEVAEDEVGIGRGRKAAAAAVAGRTWIGPGAFRSHFHRVPEAVEARDGAAARAQRVQVAHRGADQPAVDDGIEIVELHAVAGDQPDIEAGAAHVGGDQIGLVELHGQTLGGLQSRHRTRMHGLQGVGGAHLRHAAGVVHHQHGTPVAMPAQHPLQTRQTVVHLVVQVGIENRRHGAGVFALAAGHAVRQHDGNRAQQMARVFLQNDPLDLFFVRRIDHRVHQRHHEGLGAAIHQLAHRGADILRIHRKNHIATEIDALVDALDHGARHDGHRPGRGRQILLLGIAEAVAVAPRPHQGNRELEARGGEQADARTLALDQRVGAERGGVAHRIHLGQHQLDFEAELAAGILQRRHETGRQVVVGGERLALGAALAPDQKAVGEGPADIDADPLHFGGGAGSGRRCHGCGLSHDRPSP